MSNDRKEPKGNGESASERALQELFAQAQPREAPPLADAEEIRAALYAEWDALTGRRVRWRGFATAAAVAAVVAVAALLTIRTGPAPILPMIAQVERVQGPVRVIDSGRRNAVLRVGDAVEQGATLTTGSGQIVLRLASGGSLRAATETRVTLTAAAAAELMTGSLYFDSERADEPNERLTVVTALGTVRDVGTQFLAELDAGGLEVGVRDGSVLLASGDYNVAADAGEKLSVRDGRVPIRREPTATFGSAWAWAERLAPPFDIDGRQLIDFLEWVAAQTGRTLAFADPAAEQIARETVLSGSIDLEPVPKLTAVLALTDLGYSIDGGRILIAMK